MRHLYIIIFYENTQYTDKMIRTFIAQSLLSEADMARITPCDQPEPQKKRDLGDTQSRVPLLFSWQILLATPSWTKHMIWKYMPSPSGPHFILCAWSFSQRLQLNSQKENIQTCFENAGPSLHRPDVSGTENLNNRAHLGFYEDHSHRGSPESSKSGMLTKWKENLFTWKIRVRLLWREDREILGVEYYKSWLDFSKVQGALGGWEML